MTTIAYKDGLIAYDSRCTSHIGVIFDDDCDKRVHKDGVNFFLAGAPSDFDEFMEAYLKGTHLDRELSVSCFAAQSGKLYMSSVKEVKDTWIVWKEPIREGNHCALGSGENFAVAYMDLGHSAPDAVKGAMLRDTNTGGKVRTFSVADGY